MITHVAYHLEQYRKALECLDGIRKYVQLGWNVAEVRGPEQGPYLVVFRKEQAV